MFVTREDDSARVWSPVGLTGGQTSSCSPDEPLASALWQPTATATTNNTTPTTAAPTTTYEPPPLLVSCIFFLTSSFSINSITSISSNPIKTLFHHHHDRNHNHHHELHYSIVHCFHCVYDDYLCQHYYYQCCDE